MMKKLEEEFERWGLEINYEKMVIGNTIKDLEVKNNSMKQTN